MSNLSAIAISTNFNDVYEKSLYLTLKAECEISDIAAVSISVKLLAQKSCMSETKAWECIKSLSNKKLITIEKSKLTGSANIYKINKLAEASLIL